MPAVTQSDHSTSGTLQDFGCPGWVADGRSGTILLDAEVVAAFGSNLSDMVRSSASAGSSPETLVLTANPDELAARGGPTAASPARIIDLLRRDQLDLDRLRTVVAFMPDDGEAQFSIDLGFILSKCGATPQLILLSTRDVETEVSDRVPLRRLKSADLRHQLQLHEGSITMASTRPDQFIDDPADLEDRLKELVRRIHDEEDPHEMTAYKKFVKKNVSMFSRAYLTAYLVKAMVEGNGTLPAPGSSRGGKGRKDRRPAERNSSGRTGDRSTQGGQNRPAEPVGNVAPEDRQTLFVSVGKNRRVYPKDFVALFAEIDGVEGDDIGQIKILDNYSFVEVDKSVADTIIEHYNGYEFRGRKLTVNFARNKKD